ncbi:hypothetical protein BUE93_04835 [Chromobacterium amazonense]|uniref:Uncharacterized protein n=2 Tax=Chromobacterium amazonense TaxID=1382803 RepID=A0A2S9X7S5_9NEIS|nr:hypothetical protein BUE93_04835 [Chromobacterium amazonense]
MKDFFIFIVALAAAVLVWKLLTKWLRAKGHRGIVVVPLGLVVSLLSFFLAAGLMLPDPQKKVEKAEAKAEKVEPEKVAATPEKPVAPPAPAEPAIKDKRLDQLTAADEQVIKDSIKKLQEDEIAEVSFVSPEFVKITYLRKSVWDDKHWVSSFMHDALRLVQKLPQASAPFKFKKVTFLVQTATVDKLGRKGHQLGMAVTYNTEDFNGANWGNMSAWNMADMASEVSFRRLGLESAVEYCKDEDNAKYANVFCRRVVSAVM